MKPGDKVAIGSGNRSEWCLVDQAILRIGAVTVPVYPTSSKEDYAYILKHADVKVCFSGNAEIHAKGRTARWTRTPVHLRCRAWRTLVDRSRRTWPTTRTRQRCRAMRTP